jgi:hypothetical protein
MIFPTPEHIEPVPPRVRKYYNFRLWPSSSPLRINFDRLQLLTALDRNLGWLDAALSIVLAVCVGVAAAAVLDTGCYQDLAIFAFCFVVAGCQYSLLKSVQPDSASPTHGFNRVVVFSRSVYFILCCSLLLALREMVECDRCIGAVSIYGRSFPTREGLQLSVEVILWFLLLFPLVFLFGLLPQVLFVVN